MARDKDSIKVTGKDVGISLGRFLFCFFDICVAMIITEQHKKASRWRDFILGWQDGLVNVLGVTLGIASATNDAKIVIIAALAATFAESVSMMAVAYTSFKAEADFYESELAREKKEMHTVPEREKDEVRTIFRKFKFGTSLLEKVVRHITSNKKRWLDTMMELELKLQKPKVSPLNIAVVVGISAIIGSLIPVVPFLLLSVKDAILASIIFSTIILFLVGAYKGYTTTGKVLKSGIELAAIGMLAALIGYGIGAVLGITIM